jgi:phosphonate ABC transporter, permease protein PhnE
MSGLARSAARRAAVAAVIIVLCVWAAQGIRLDIQRIGRGLPAIVNIFALMVPDRQWLWPAIEAMGETLAIALIGTTIGALAAVPVAFLAARNVVVYRAAAAVGRQVSNAIRAFPELVLGVFFVASYGPGAAAGALAIGVHSIGMLARLYADIIENVDPGPAEALLAAGATRLQVFRFAILPQVLPEFIATALYRFEINLRSANVLGLVGAGGIGVVLLQALTLRRWGVVGACLLVIIAAVSAVDYGSAWLRRRLV